MGVLITGGAGYVGSHIALDFLDMGRQVVIFDNLSTGRDFLIPETAVFVQGDTRDTQTLERVMCEHGIETVIHCAASTVVPESVAHPLEYYDNNVQGTISLLRAMGNSAVDRIIFSSTAAVYAVGDGTPLSEQSPTEPVSPYGRTKLIAEHLIQDVAGNGSLKYAILRYFNVAGADPKGRSGQSTPNATHLIKLALETAVGKRSAMTVFGTDWPTPDGTGIRDFIHVSDLARAHTMADLHLVGGGASGVMNCGYGHGYSVYEVIAMVEAVSGVALNIVNADRRPGDLPMVIADPALITSAIGWKPNYNDLRTIIEHAFEWERAQLN